MSKQAYIQCRMANIMLEKRTDALVFKTNKDFIPMKVVGVLLLWNPFIRHKNTPNISLRKKGKHLIPAPSSAFLSWNSACEISSILNSNKQMYMSFTVSFRLFRLSRLLGVNRDEAVQILNSNNKRFSHHFRHLWLISQYFHFKFQQIRLDLPRGKAILALKWSKPRS